MATEQDLKELHDKLTGGLALTAEEQASLDAWYAQLDRDESSVLAGTPPSQTLAGLYVEIETVTGQLVRTTQRIQATTAENDRLRRELAELREDRE